MLSPMPTSAPTPSLDQKTIRTSPILWILGVLFALFLGALGTQGLSAVADLFTQPGYSAFERAKPAPRREQRSAPSRLPDPREPKTEAPRKDVSDLDRAV